MTNIPKRRFALEEKDLSVEADENNRVAEEKENRFVKKIQEEALNEIKHLPTDKILDRLPNPTGWRILVLPYKGQGKTKGGIILSDETIEERGYTTVTALVLKVGQMHTETQRDFQTDHGARKMTGLYSVATPDPDLE